MNIHRYWQGEPVEFDFSTQLLKLHPKVSIQDWGPDTLPSWIRDLTEALAEQVVQSKQVFHAANVARVGLLYEYGGWWVDWDLEPLVAFDWLPMNATAAHGVAGTRCGCWLAFPVQHPALGKLISVWRRNSNILTSSRHPAEVVSGSPFLERTLPRTVARVPVDQIGLHAHASSRGRRQPCL